MSNDTKQDEGTQSPGSEVRTGEHVGPGVYLFRTGQGRTGQPLWSTSPIYDDPTSARAGAMRAGNPGSADAAIPEPTKNEG